MRSEGLRAQSDLKNIGEKREGTDNHGGIVAIPEVVKGKCVTGKIKIRKRQGKARKDTGMESQPRKA